MPFTAQEIQDAGKIGLDFYLKNKPVDQVAIDRPLMQALVGKKQAAPGGKQYIVEQIRTSYQSNFQWFNGSQVVTYNRRQTIEQVQYQWRSAHDGFALDEDRLAQNGIVVHDDQKPTEASGAEKLQLTNLIEEQVEVLGLGFKEQFDRALHLDGTQSSDAIAGLDGLISLTPTTGTVGGIDRSVAANAYWRNQVSTGLTVTTTTGTILDNMETTWRACTRNGGRPDIILVGSTFLDGFRNFMLKTYGRIDFQGVGFGKRVDAGTETDMLTFHGVPMTWDPVFADLDTLYAPATLWEKRCYFINSKTVKLRPLDGHDMISRKPPRAYDKYEYYWGLTWRGAITMNRSNANAVLALA
jgi:hypothetical protein